MKRYYIPNSLFFKAIPIALDSFLAIFSIEKKIHDVYNVKSVRISTANAYAKRMYKRLDRQSSSGNAMRFEKLVTIIMERSQIYQVIALNKKYPKWFQDIKFSQFKKLWTKIMVIKQSMSSEIKYRRVWIPKGLEKYMRPLGCPDIEWIIQTWLIYYMLDYWTYHNNGRASWQHGGFSRKGSNTFYDEFIGGKLWTKPYIYEFDLKGYFNNISHEAILKALEATALPKNIYNHIKAAIKVQPYGYSIPPIEEDKAAKLYQELEERYKVIDRLISEVKAEYWEVINNTRGRIIWGTSSRMPNHAAFERWAMRYSMVLKEVRYLETGRDDSARMSYVRSLREKALIYQGPSILFNFENTSMPIDLQTYYKNLMEIGKTTNISNVKKSFQPITEEQRQKGRDNWAGLGKEGYGTPQGVAYSPTLTSIASSYFLRKSKDNLIMYMDDGIIYADSQKELDTAKLEFEKGVKALGVEIQPKKSGMVKVNGEWLKDLKIIGFRIDRFMDWIFSQTRSGTERPIPRPDFELLEGYQPGEFDKRLNDALSKLNKIPEGSRDRLQDWIRSRLEQIRDHPLEIVSKEGYTGAMLSHIWNPKPQSREDIEAGISKAKFSLSHKKYTFIYDRFGPDYISDVQSGIKSLNSVSTEMNISLLEWLERRGMNSSRKSNLTNSKKSK